MRSKTVILSRVIHQSASKEREIGRSSISALAGITKSGGERKEGQKLVRAGVQRRG